MFETSGRNSAAERPLRLRARQDLEFFPQMFALASYWVVKDPVTLRYFQLREEEYSILRWLDGEASLADVARRFQEKFAPQRLTEGRLAHFIGSLHSLGLILSDRSGQGEPLLLRARNRRSRAIRAALSNVLAIRLPGVDPGRFLELAYPVVSWLFRPWCLLACVVLVFVALFSVILNPTELTARLPQTQAFFGPGNLVWLMVCLASVKILHELGHAMACRHFGCQCHEIGLLFLVFTPCLYCDITDSWTLTDKRGRMAIAAAGICVELLLASIATLLWWSTTESLLSALCLNVMFLCSVNTIFLNGNPLLRYDGYYLLSDWLEIPNLWQRSRNLLASLAGRVLLGTSRETAMPEQRPVLLAAYGLLSVIYRFVVIVAILGLLDSVLRPRGLEVLAHVVSAMTILALFAAPVVALARSAAAPKPDQPRPGRRRIVLSAIAILAALFCVVPLPCRVRAPGLLEPDRQQRVYVTVPGRIVTACRVGESVRRGDILAVLESDELALEITRLAAQTSQQSVEVRALEARRGKDPLAAAELPTARETLVALEARLTARQEEAKRLTLTAARDGIVVPRPARTAPKPDMIELTSWQGLPTEPENVGAFLETGTLICTIADPRRLKAIAYVGEQDVQLVRQGDAAWLLLDQSRRTFLTGKVVRIDASRLEVVPASLAATGAIPYIQDGQFALPVETRYRVEISLDEHDEPWMVGLRGQAKIAVAPRSIVQRSVRFLGNTFRRAR